MLLRGGQGIGMSWCVWHSKRWPRLSECGSIFGEAKIFVISVLGWVVERDRIRSVWSRLRKDGCEYTCERAKDRSKPRYHTH